GRAIAINSSGFIFVSKPRIVCKFIFASTNVSLERHCARSETAKTTSHSDVVRICGPRQLASEAPAAVVLQRANQSTGRRYLDTKRRGWRGAGGVNAQPPARTLVLSALNVDGVNRRRWRRRWRRR